MQTKFQSLIRHYYIRLCWLMCEPYLTAFRIDIIFHAPVYYPDLAISARNGRYEEFIFVFFSFHSRI